MHVKTFVEVSTAFVYKSQTKAPADERAKLDPWTLQAKYKLQAEEELRALDGLHLVFVRPATVYGSGDVGGLMPRLVCAAAYSALGEKMKLLWDGEMRVNTAHGVTNTPLTPYMDKELLGHNHLYVDGSKIETTGFEYTYPSVQLDQVRALVQDAIDQRLFPPVLA
ncbi:hypothetical protein DYB37_012203 [Aphanomyces astaci]|uniref:NAD-dependent epimerase/dehydratase domain-containing protein n=1 Tax=Aphanomyces astaci TaxID=112090 RepID=A0A418D4J0_APHAT|nr:hypothetical protein DYB35_007907 [Aphanomyces astaci]RHZ18473.1 hypothetical protein DYB37_012203 [Aphanomyces astaci]